MSSIEVDERLSWTLSNGGSQGCTGDGEDRRARYRFQQLATGLGRVCPDFDPVWSIRRLGSAPAAAFANRVAHVGSVTDEVDAPAMFHDTRSYFGFHPRAIPADITHEAV